MTSKTQAWWGKTRARVRVSGAYSMIAGGLCHLVFESSSLSSPSSSYSGAAPPPGGLLRSALRVARSPCFCCTRRLRAGGSAIASQSWLSAGSRVRIGNCGPFPRVCGSFAGVESWLTRSARGALTLRKNVVNLLCDRQRQWSLRGH